MAVSKLKIGIIDDVKNRKTGTISEHSGQVRDIIGRTSQDAERVYYGLTTNGNPPPTDQLASASREDVSDVIGKVTVGMLNAATDGIKTFEKNHPDMKSVAMPSGINKARLTKMLVENNKNLGLEENDNAGAAKIVDEALDKHKSEITAAQKKWSETAKNSKMFIAVSSGNERNYSDKNDPDAAQNMFLNDNVVGVAATNSEGTIASYSSPGSKVRFSASGETGMTDEKGNPVEGTSFAAPRVAAAAGDIMNEGKTKQEALAVLDKQVKQAKVKSDGDTDGEASEMVQASARDTGKGFLNIPS